MVVYVLCCKKYEETKQQTKSMKFEICVGTRYYLMLAIFSIWLLLVDICLHPKLRTKKKLLIINLLDF